MRHCVILWKWFKGTNSSDFSVLTIFTWMEFGVFGIFRKSGFEFRKYGEMKTGKRLSFLKFYYDCSFDWIIIECYLRDFLFYPGTWTVDNYTTYIPIYKHCTINNIPIDSRYSNEQTSQTDVTVISIWTKNMLSIKEKDFSSFFASFVYSENLWKHDHHSTDTLCCLSILNRQFF